MRLRLIRHATLWVNLAGKDTLVDPMLGPVSGFVVRAPEEPSFYVAGDTVWCPEVEQALRTYEPDVVEVNAGAAQFIDSDPITMDADDVAQVARAAPRAKVVAVHMEAINHCVLTRIRLGEAIQHEGPR